MTDAEAMARALALAERGRGFVEPNPLVGAVALDDAGNLAGEGWHQRFGGPHAEIHALDAAGARARGGTLFVTLEPCCHHGKTPPCTDRVVAAGVRRVVAALADPFPAVAGQGAAVLRAAGVQIDFGPGAAAARRQNAPYLCLLKHARPFVHGKWAMSADGKIATAAGASQWITGPEARAHAHAFRGLVDGILVGVGTALADDPLLTARPPGPRVPVRVALDSRLRLPTTSQLAATAGEIPTLILCGDRADPRARQALADAGCEVLPMPSTADGRVSVAAALAEFGRRRWTNLLVEGGAGVLGTFAAGGFLDTLRIYLAPKIIGGAAAPGPVGDPGFSLLNDALSFPVVAAEPVGGDLFLSAWPA